MNINLNGGNLLGMSVRTFANTGMLKSTQERMERQQKTQEQILFYENQKENLKNKECSTLEEIARKLDMFHTYEDEIAAAKQAYNDEQMWHAMDEAKELGERIAEQAKKYEPKTPEERKEEMVEEALGTDEEKGELAEAIEEIEEKISEVSEEALEETEETLEQLEEEAVLNESKEQLENNAAADTAAESANASEKISAEIQKELLERRQKELNYVPIDLKA